MFKAGEYAIKTGAHLHVKLDAIRFLYGCQLFEILTLAIRKMFPNPNRTLKDKKKKIFDFVFSSLNSSAKVYEINQNSFNQNLRNSGNPQFLQDFPSNSDRNSVPARPSNSIETLHVDSRSSNQSISSRSSMYPATLVPAADMISSDHEHDYMVDLHTNVRPPSKDQLIIRPRKSSLSNLSRTSKHQSYKRNAVYCEYDEEAGLESTDTILYKVGERLVWSKKLKGSEVIVIRKSTNFPFQA